MGPFSCHVDAIFLIHKHVLKITKAMKVKVMGIGHQY